MQDETDCGGEMPCFAHKLVGGAPVDPETRRDVARFRRAERQRLLDLRRATSVAEAKAQAAKLASALTDLIGPLDGRIVSAYWPIRGELDLRPWMASAEAAGARLTLPVVAAKDDPLVFRGWRPGCRMERGIWNIPVPAEGALLVPDIVLAPVLGIDAEGYRLGNGGGYYDRTLANFAALPRRIGIGHAFSRISTIFAMPWDVPMTEAVLGDGTVLHF